MERSRSETINRKKHRAVEEQDMGKPERDKHFVNIKTVWGNKGKEKVGLKTNTQKTPFMTNRFFFLAYVTFFPSPQQEAFFPRIFLGKLEFY